MSPCPSLVSAHEWGMGEPGRRPGEASGNEGLARMNCRGPWPAPPRLPAPQLWQVPISPENFHPTGSSTYQHRSKGHDNGLDLGTHVRSQPHGLWERRMLAGLLGLKDSVLTGSGVGPQGSATEGGFWLTKGRAWLGLVSASSQHLAQTQEAPSMSRVNVPAPLLPLFWSLGSRGFLCLSLCPSLKPLG